MTTTTPGDESAAPTENHAQVMGRTASSRLFWVGLLAVTGGGLAVRLLYSLRIPKGLLSDGTYYHEQANLLAAGHGFIQPFRFTFEGVSVATAIHPPLWSGVLSVFSALGWRGVDSHRVVGCVLGAGAVLVLGIVGRKLLGPRAGIIAAAIAAVYPNFWLGDGMLESTSLFLLLLALLLLASYAWISRPTIAGAFAIGALVGLLSLTRGEGFALFAFLVIPIILLERRLDLRRRLAMLATALTVGAVVLLPWFVYNTTRFERPVLISTNGDYSLAASYCDPAYSGSLIGFNDPFACVPGPRLRPTPDYRTAPEDESEWAQRIRGRAFDYFLGHLDEFPRVVAARVGRVWDFYHPGQNVDLDALAGRDRDTAHWGQIVYWAMLPAALAGAVVLKRRGQRILPLVALIALVTVTAAVSFGEIRLRAGGEVALVLLGAAALTRLTGPLPSPADTDAAAGGSPRVSDRQHERPRKSLTE